MKYSVSASLLAAVAAVALSVPAVAETIGTAGAVNPDARGTPPGGAARTLNVGGNVVYRERINTAANGSVQLIFVDRTTLNIGPNSQLVIDEFVYDPKTNTGRMAATLTKGVMRFVGGQTSHTGGAMIKTPATTLGVRGGVATIKHDTATGTRVINHFGTITAQTSSGTEVIRRPGFALNVATGQGAPTAPVRVARTEIDTNNQQLTSRGSQTGGRRETPTDQGASRAVGQANAPVGPNLVQGQQPQNTQQSARITAQPNTMQQDVPLQQVAQISTTGTQQTTTASLPALATPAVPTKRWYAMQEVAKIGEFLPAAFKSNGVWQETATVGYGAGGLNPEGAYNTTSRMMAAGLVINGSGTSQTSTIYFANMDLYPETAGNIPGGGYTATTRLASNARMGRLSGSITPTEGSMTFDSAYSPTAVTLNQQDIYGGVRQPGTTSSYTYYVPNSPSISGNINYEVQLARAATPAGLGAVRPTGYLEGFASGLLTTFSAVSGLQRGGTAPITGWIDMELSDSSRFGGSIIAVNASQQTYTNGTDFGLAYYGFGYQGSGTRARSAYVDYDYFGARSSRLNDGSLGGEIMSETYRKDSTGNIVLAPMTNENGLMVNSKAVNAESFFPGVTFCQCDYTRWGFWSWDARREGTTVAGSPEYMRDQVHLGTWVAGQMTPGNLVPTTGQATFTGHAIGSIKNGNSEYVAAGNFLANVNFGTNALGFNVSNLDGRSYAGGGSIYRGILQDGTAYATIAGASSNNNTHSMSIYGQFMNGAAGPAAEMGGRFSIQSSPNLNYMGVGIFAARR